MPIYRPAARCALPWVLSRRHTQAWVWDVSLSGRTEGPDRTVGPFGLWVGQTDLWVMRPYRTIRIAATMAPRISGIHAMPDEFE